MFSEYFDGDIFCLNRNSRPDRWAEAQAELALCEIDRCERFQAVHDGASNGASGCAASHRSMWRRIAVGVGKRALIFEDDFKFLTRGELIRVGYVASQAEVRIFDSCPGQSLTERFAFLAEHVPQHWDLLYLGGGYECKPHGRVNRYVIRNAGMLCTHAYAISREFAQKMTAHLDAGYHHESDPAIHSGPPDSVLASLSKNPDVFSYTLSPRLFIQRPTSRSDLDPKPPGFPWSMTDSAHEMMV